MSVIERRECKGCSALFGELHSRTCPIGRHNGAVLLPQSHVVEYVPADQLQGAVEDAEREQARYYAMRDDRDRLQALVDAHKVFLRDALNRLGGQ